MNTVRLFYINISNIHQFCIILLFSFICFKSLNHCHSHLTNISFFHRSENIEVYYDKINNKYYVNIDLLEL